MDFFGASALFPLIQEVTPSELFQEDPVGALLYYLEQHEAAENIADVFAERNREPSYHLYNYSCGNILGRTYAALNSRDFNQTVALATECIQFIEKAGLTSDVKHEALCLRAEAKFQLKQYQDAFNDVTTCIACEPRYVNGLILLPKILTGKEEYEKAFIFCIFLINKYEISHHSLMKVVKQSVSIAPKVENGFRELLALSNIDNSIWNDVTVELASEGAWSLVKVILFGTDDISGIDMNIDAKRIKLSDLIEYCGVNQWMQWGQKLVLFLLKHGANYKTICPLSKLPLHAALAHGLKTDTFDLLKELFSKHIKPAEINETDGNGNTLLHLACSHENSSVRTTAINLLLNHNIDMTVKNKSGKTARELLPEGHPDSDIIEGKMEMKAKSSAVGSDKDEQRASLQSELIISRQWSKARVQKWLAECKMTQCREKFRNIEGTKLHELRILQDECPDVFYSILEKSLQLDLVEILKLSAALRNWKPE